MEALQLITAIGLGIVFVSMAIFIKATRGWPDVRPDRNLLREAQVYAAVAVLCLLGCGLAALFIAGAPRAYADFTVLSGAAGIGVIVSIARMTEKRRLRDLASREARTDAKGGGR